MHENRYHLFALIKWRVRETEEILQKIENGVYDSAFNTVKAAGPAETVTLAKAFSAQVFICSLKSEQPPKIMCFTYERG